ncbi:OmpH family outer membrane protein [Pontibacter qinzhouensis]|uniref:OmpH family outer membrane protein n=1 Tax=Pontibacter qinzhouensis TaxID=2603253 RepID=A0A5C8JGB4_9BACT|nr:OmpH family outer membrane protein [Pontibacter qinzhouensis]TXK36638.1 OmpH family outer membrane protein [Pontibacter qinzhouensis]
MKKYLLAFLVSFLVCFVSEAQKFGYIDSDFILSKMPAYTKAQQELDKYTDVWQKEIETMHQEVDKLKQEFRAEEVLLTDEMKQKRQADITKKEAEVRDYQRKVFGYEGMMFKRRQDLIRPIQDEVFTAVEKVAKARGLQVIFDKSGDLVMIYTNPVHDYTEYVLEELGLASEKQNTAGNRTNTAIDSPDNLPEVGEDGTTEGNSNQPATGKAANPAPSKAAPKKK